MCVKMGVISRFLGPASRIWMAWSEHLTIPKVEDVIVCFCGGLVLWYILNHQTFLTFRLLVRNQELTNSCSQEAFETADLNVTFACGQNSTVEKKNYVQFAQSNVHVPVTLPSRNKI